MNNLPGGDLIESGLEDLRRNMDSIPALLVSIGAPKLTALGFNVPVPIANPEVQLYKRLSEDIPEAAHSRYNALIRRLVSFEHAAAIAKH